MFLRKMGRRYLLLHAYRDGRGRVCQRRLGHFEGAEEMRQRLLEPEWRAGLQRDYPDVRMDWGRLSQDAQRLEAQPTLVRPPVSRGKASLQGLVRKLVRAAAEEQDQQVLTQALQILQSRVRSLQRVDPQLQRGEEYLQAGQFVEAEAEFEAVVWKSRLDLPAARSRLEEPEAGAHLRALRGLSEALEAQGRLAESSQVAQQRVRMNPARQALVEYGARLQQEGRLEEAAAQYRRIPWNHGWRHFNLASLAWQQGKREECAEHLLNGLVQADDVAYCLLRIYRQQSPGRSHSYWESFGKLWDEQGRGFVLALYWDPLVRYELEQIRLRHVGCRGLMRNWSLKKLLDRVESRMSGGDRNFRLAVPWRP